MSEIQTNPGDPSLFSSTVKGEKAGNFEESFGSETVTEEAVEAEEPQAEVQAEEAEEVEAAAEPEGETPEERLVRETTERLRKQAQEQAAPPAPPQELYAGELQALKEQIAQMGRAQDVPEPKGGFDFSVLEDQNVQAQLQAARESDDPTAEARALAVIAQHVVQAEKGKDTEDLRQELESMKRQALQQRQMEYNQRVFESGIQAAKNLGGVEAALVKQFEDARELDHWRAHIAQHGPNLDGYAPQSLLGAWLMDRDPVTNQPNAIFAGNPSLFQAGVIKFARDLQAASGVQPEAEKVSTTGAGVPVRGSSASKDMANDNAEASPEERILGAILAANEKRKGKAKAFR